VAYPNAYNIMILLSITAYMRIPASMILLLKLLVSSKLYCTHERQLAHQQIHTGSDNIIILSICVRLLLNSPRQ